MTLQAIKEAIGQLPEAEKRELAQWFEEAEEAAWDRQIEHDFRPGGRGDRVLFEIRKEVEEGRAQSFDLKARQKPKSGQ